MDKRSWLDSVNTKGAFVRKESNFRQFVTGRPYTHCQRKPQLRMLHDVTHVALFAQCYTVGVEKMAALLNIKQ